MDGRAALVSATEAYLSLLEYQRKLWLTLPAPLTPETWPPTFPAEFFCVRLHVATRRKTDDPSPTHYLVTHERFVPPTPALFWDSYQRREKFLYVCLGTKNERRQSVEDAARSAALIGSLYLPLQELDHAHATWLWAAFRAAPNEADRHHRLETLYQDQLRSEGRFCGLVSELCYPPTGEANLTGAATSTNARMIDTLQRRAESRTWSVRAWADALGVSKSSVQEQPCWKEIQRAKEAAKQSLAEKAIRPWE